MKRYVFEGLKKVVVFGIVFSISFWSPVSYGRVESLEVSHRVGKSTVVWIDADRNGMPEGIAVSSPAGTEIRVDANGDGYIDLLRIEAGDFQIEQSKLVGSKFENVTIIKREEHRKVIGSFKLSSDQSRYDLWELSTKQYETFYRESGHFAPSASDNNLICSLRSLNENQVEDWVRGPLFEKISTEAFIKDPSVRALVDAKSCGAEGADKILRGMEKVLSPQKSGPGGYLACYDEITGKRGEGKALMLEKWLWIKAGGGKNFVRCDHDLPAGKIALLNERSGSEKNGIGFSRTFVKSAASEDSIAASLFHEFIHEIYTSDSRSNNQEDENHIKKLEACCAEGKQLACLSLKRDYESRPELIDNVQKGESHSMLGTLPDAELKNNLARGADDVKESASREPAQYSRLRGDNQKLMSTVAQQSPSVVRHTVAQARDTFKKLDTSLIPVAHAGEPIKTKLRTFDANGTPTLTLTNGKKVSVHMPFVVPNFNSSDGTSQILASNQLGTVTGRSASGRRPAATGSANANSALQAAMQAESEAGSNGAGSAALGVTGGSGESGGGAIGSARPSKTKAQRRPQAQRSSARNSQRVELKSDREVIQVLRQTSEPRKLLEEPWFINDLKRLKIQIVDGGRRYGSPQPVTTWNLQMFERRNNP